MGETEIKTRRTRKREKNTEMEVRIPEKNHKNKEERNRAIDHHRDMEEKGW